VTLVTVSCSAPITSFEALGVTVTETGNSVDDSILAEFLQIGQAEGVVLTVGGIAENLGPVPQFIYNPTTGSPAYGQWTVGSVCIDSVGAFFLFTGSPGNWIAVATGGGGGSPDVVDGGDVSSSSIGSIDGGSP
jgi:hypothetical protein